MKRLLKRIATVAVIDLFALSCFVLGYKLGHCNRQSIYHPDPAAMGAEYRNLLFNRNLLFVRPDDEPINHGDERLYEPTWVGL
jgi:hypothetical protein